MQGVLRPRADGHGYSECYAPDELVGKGRCCHILGGDDKPSLELRKLQRGMYEVDIGDSTMSVQAEKETMTKFFESMQNISDEKVHKIISFLNEE